VRALDEPAPVAAAGSVRPTGGAGAANRPPLGPLALRAPEPELAELDGPGWLGVELQARLPDEPGVLVRSVVPGSPAARAGLLDRDVIVSVDGTSVSRPPEVITAVAGRRPGDRVAIAFLRGGSDRLVAVTLEAIPNEEALMRKRYVDAQAPAFSELKSVQGRFEPNLASLRGKVVLLEFWATWCAPCRLTAPLLSEWSDRHAAEGLAVVGVTSDAFQVAATGAREAKMSYAVFSDESGATIRDYRAFALPTLFVIDRRGVVRDVMVGLSSERLREIERLFSRLLAER
jgi:thiol-disulfide isomerase/thioredoxin